LKIIFPKAGTYGETEMKSLNLNMFKNFRAINNGNIFKLILEKATLYDDQCSAHTETQ
jgi:hypothetical protein